MVGHLTFRFMLRRPLLSILSAVYQFIRKLGPDSAAMWLTVRAELECARDGHAVRRDVLARPRPVQAV